MKIQSWAVVLVLLCAACGEEAAEPNVAPLPEGSFVDDGIDEGKYHPRNFADPANHGPQAMLQQDNCTECHGDTLEGGTSEISCDQCHKADWRTDCIFCHGGLDGDEGAPPTDIPGHEGSTFKAHTAHVQGTIHEPFGCEQCHTQPTDVLSPGHFMIGDDTPGVAEVTFTEGLSNQGVYQGDGSCSNLYCHGNGQSHNGDSNHNDAALGCESCHPNKDSGFAEWRQMSGRHFVHLAHGATCSMCHRQAIDPLNRLKPPFLHINGTPDVELLDTIEYDPTRKTCTGGCHLANEFETHNGRPW